MKTAVLIPARFQSSRYPGKPLVELAGANGKKKPLILRSYEAAKKARGVQTVMVLTDDDRIANACEKWSIPFLMTAPECANGTERCADALGQLEPFDLVVNFQGDALLTPPHFIEALIAGMAEDEGAMVATPAMRMRSTEVRTLQAEEASGRVGGTSVVIDEAGRALYFSKRLIPYLPKRALEGEMSPNSASCRSLCLSARGADRICRCGTMRTRAIGRT